MRSAFALWLSFATVSLAGTSRFKLALTWTKGSPDGYERDMVHINGQYPGPTLRIQQGDWVEVEVCNQMPFNSSIHFHGIQQTDTPWADGVPGLTQRPIQPGASYLYKWHADQYGAFWYHAHSRGQIEDGANGPIIIKPQSGNPNPFAMISETDVQLLEDAEAHVHPLMLQDWRHRTADQTWNDTLASGIDTTLCLDSIVVNGKGSINCWSRAEINAAVAPGVARLIGAAGLQYTDKGCLSLQGYELFNNSTDYNLSVVPPEVFEICTPTNGSREVINAHGKKWIALDVISSASIISMAFGVDQHPMWVYAVDGHYIEPLKVNMLNVNNGDRFSVFVQLNNKPGDYGIRVASRSENQYFDTAAILSYGGGHGNHYPGANTNVTSVSWFTRGGEATSKNVTLFEQAKMVSFPPQFPQPAPEVSQTVFLNTGNAGIHPYVFALNSTPFDHAVLDNEAPPFLYQQPSALNPGENITIVTKNNTWVDLVFVVSQIGQVSHVMHKHANKGFILGAAEGTFNWTTVAEAAKAIPRSFNLVNPPYRDGFATIATEIKPSWLAVRYHVTNPGPWLLHCHIQDHFRGGMAAIILDGVDAWPVVPDEYKN